MDQEAWYSRSFGEDYLLIYKHRDLDRAYQEVKQMIAWLNLPRDAEVLDLCCGMGRHALALADFGYQVTGVDLSKVLLSHAQQLDQDHRVTWIRGDMRQVPLQQKYDAVVNLFTSFGYFKSDEENAQVLQEMNRLLKPQSPWIIDFLNPVYIRNHLVPYSKRMTDGTLIEEHRRIEADMVIKDIQLTSPDQQVRQYQERVKLYELADFERMLENTFLQIDQVFGDTDRNPYISRSSKRMILVGKKVQ